MAQPVGARPNSTPTSACKAPVKIDSGDARELSAHERFGTQLSRTTAGTKVPPPPVDSITYSLSHIGAFPYSYEVVQSDTLKKFIDGEFGALQYWIDREDVESGDETNLLSFLAEISASREVALALCGKVEFMVHGYDSDPREVYEIPELRAFLRRVDEQWPYWMLYQLEEGYWLRMLALCLVKCERQPDGHVEFDGPEMQASVDSWFSGLNELSHRFALSVALNKEATERSVKVLFGIARGP